MSPINAVVRPRVRAALVAVVALFALTVQPAVAQTEAPVEVQGIDASGFPLIRAVVSGPGIEGTDLDTAFVVIEDGTERALDVVRLRADELSVVVAIDVSGSMEGEPLAKAKAAVGSLLQNLSPDVPVSIISFGEGVVISHDFSTDRASVQAAVDGLIAAGRTALYDGVDRSLAQLSRKGGTGALVVLADGGDSESTTAPEAVAERLASSGVAASFVALESEGFEPASIQFLADAAGGPLVAVEDAGQFADAFSRIAAGLSGLYELRWTSASEGEQADLSIALASDPSSAVSTSVAHDTVRRFVPDIADEIRTVPAAGAFDAPWLPYAAAFGVSLGAFLILGLMRGSESAAERREEKRTDRQSTKEARKRRTGGVHDRLNDISAHVLENNDRGRSLDDTLDRAGLAVRSNEFVVFCTGIVVASLFAGVLLFGIPYFLVAVLFPAAGIPLFLKFKIGRRRKKFVNQLGDTLQLMAGSLTAGYGLGQTLDSVARETDVPTCDEFQRVVMETRLGRSLEDALDAMSIRIGAPDFDWVVDAIKIQSSVGGNLSEIIAQVGETIRARSRIRRQVDALTAEGKISALVLFTLPLGLFGFIYSSNPAYIRPMFSSGMGQVMMGSALLMLSIGGLWLKKLVNPEF